MPRKKRTPLTLKERLQKIAASGVGVNPIEQDLELEALESLEERVQKIFKIVDKIDRKASDMLFFVMYDIESTKVRNQVAKYLIKCGCQRIQKSIFLANISAERYNAIKLDLAEIQSFYDNQDSILIAPISSDYLQSMKVIGRSLDIDIITRSKNTIFF